MAERSSTISTAEIQVSKITLKPASRSHSASEHGHSEPATSAPFYQVRKYDNHTSISQKLNAGSGYCIYCKPSAGNELD